LIFYKTVVKWLIYVLLKAVETLVRMVFIFISKLKNYRILITFIFLIHLTILHIMFLRFPSNKQAAVIWTNIIKKIQPSYMPLKTSMICSAHFKYSDYNSNCKKIRLNDNAVPSIFITSNIK